MLLHLLVFLLRFQTLLTATLDSVSRVALWMMLPSRHQIPSQLEFVRSGAAVVAHSAPNVLALA